MDLPCVQWQDHVAQKWIGLEPELKEHFMSLSEIDDVFKCALTLTTQDDVDLLQSISAGHCVQKYAEKAAKCREGGNSSFKARDYTAAALHYSQGVCAAPRCSEQLSLCYANRSAALCHLQLYQESLDDIDEALKSGYPSQLSHKLESRRTQCLQGLSLGGNAKESKNTGSSDRLRTEPLKIGIHPQAAVGFSPEKGRHLVASERIAPGEIVLTDRPYCCVLIPGTEGVLFGVDQTRCHRCLSETRRPVPCDGCSYSRYCSTVCRQKAWEEHHQWECPLGALLMATGVLSQLALRVALKAGLKNIQIARDANKNKHPQSEPNSVKGESDFPPSCDTSHFGDSYASVFHLLHHLQRQSIALRFLCAVTVATLHQKLSKKVKGQSSDEEGGAVDWGSEQWMLGSAVLRHFLQLRCNAQAILLLQDTGAANSPVQSSREVRMATAIFPTLSLLNHSCRPNTSLVFSPGTRRDDPSGWDLSAECCRESASENGVTATVRSATVIAAGQEILHCYGPHSSRMETKERLRLLEDQYYFLCQCEACARQQDATKGSRQRSTDVTLGDTRESGLLCGKCKGPLKESSGDEGSGFVCPQSSCGRRLSSSEVGHRLQEIRLLLKKAVDLMEGDRPDEALRLLKRTCQSGLILAETHPLQGEMEDAMARACATMGDWNKAASHLEQSAVAIGHQYGRDSIELGRQLFKVAQLHFNGGAKDKTLSIIPKAKRLIRRHIGPNCEELQELQAMEHCIRG